MSDYSEKLNALTKGLEKPSKVRVEEFTKVLTEMYNSEGNYDELVDWLLRTHYLVGKSFFEINKITPPEAIGILNAVENHPLLKKSVQGFLFNRLFVICRAYIVNNVDLVVTAKLAYAIVFYGKQKGKFSSSMIKGFGDIISNEKERQSFASLPEYCENSHDKRVLADFVDACELKVEEQKKEEIKADNEDTNDTSTVVTPKNDVSEVPPHDPLIIPAMVDQLKAQLDRLIKTNEIIEILRSQVKDREIDIERLNQELKNSKGENYSLRRDLEAKQEEIGSYEEIIDDLEQRLKSVFEMDDSIRSQELMTLKKDVADAIRMEYLDYKDSDQTFNEDNFVANSASLERVFKILIRFGFEIDQ